VFLLSFLLRIFTVAYYVVDILGNLNRIPTSQNFFAAFCGVEVLVQQYLRIANSDATKVGSLSGKNQSS